MNSEKTKSKNTGVIVGAAAAVAVAAAAFAGAGGAVQLPGFSHDAPLKLTRISTAPIFAPPPGAPLSFADIFEKVSPAVVSIEVTSRVDMSALQRQFGLPFNLDPRGQGQGQGQGQGRGGRPSPGLPTPKGGNDDDDDGPEAQASGSGFFISADGYIVTNNHVVENAKEIKVLLKDKRELKATVVGTDPNTDLAVLKVEGRNFQFVNFENAGNPRVGDWVIAIGNPFGLSATATAGIVSAYNRNLPNDSASQFVDYLQIDAPINPGNSGGPTFDVYGRVIGVNSAIYSPSARGGSVGIGFAIPAEIAENIAKQLISSGKIARGYLGARVRPVTKEFAEGLGLDITEGAFVNDVPKGGPAAKAGVQAGDVITSVNGKKVADSTALTRAVAATRAGDNLRLEIVREGKPMTVNVKAGLRPSDMELAAGNDNEDEGSTGPGATPDKDKGADRPTVLGMEVTPLDPATRRRLQTPADVSGVVIQDVESSSAAGKAGLQPGDIILMARGVRVNTPAELQAAVDAQKRGNRSSIALMVMRDGQPATILLDMKEKEEKKRG